MNKLLISQVSKELSELRKKDVEFQYTHRLTGRIFDVRCLGERSYFVAEYVPCDEHLRLAVKKNPNDSLEIFKRLGVTPNNVPRTGGGLGTHTIYHNSLSDIASVIATAIETNTIVKHCMTKQEYDEKVGAVGLAKEAIRDAEESVRYWFSQANAGSTNSGIFNGTSNMFGDLSKSIKDRVLSFINDPSEETWNECYSIIIVGHRTLWQIWCANDPYAPRGLSESGRWPRLPDSRELVTWIEESVKESKLRAIDKLAEAKIELARVKAEYRTLTNEGQDSATTPSM